MSLGGASTHKNILLKSKYARKDSSATLLAFTIDPGHEGAHRANPVR